LENGTKHWWFLSLSKRFWSVRKKSFINSICFGMLRLVVWQILTDVSGRITLMMEAVSSSESSVNIYQTTRCNIPEDSHFILFAVRTWNIIYLLRLYKQEKVKLNHIKQTKSPSSQNALKILSVSVMWINIVYKWTRI
jgi:hypothetical protein